MNAEYCMYMYICRTCTKLFSTQTWIQKNWKKPLTGRYYLNALFCIDMLVSQDCTKLHFCCLENGLPARNTGMRNWRSAFRLTFVHITRYTHTTITSFYPLKSHWTQFIFSVPYSIVRRSRHQPWRAACSGLSLLLQQIVERHQVCAHDSRKRL